MSKFSLATVLNNYDKYKKGDGLKLLFLNTPKVTQEQKDNIIRFCIEDQNLDKKIYKSIKYRIMQAYTYKGNSRSKIQITKMINSKSLSEINNATIIWSMNEFEENTPINRLAKIFFFLNQTIKYLKHNCFIVAIRNSDPYAISDLEALESVFNKIDKKSIDDVKNGRIELISMLRPILKKHGKHYVTIDYKNDLASNEYSIVFGAKGLFVDGTLIKPNNEIESQEMEIDQDSDSDLEEFEFNSDGSYYVVLEKGNISNLMINAESSQFISEERLNNI